jgi:hypothetical protein
MPPTTGSPGLPINHRSKVIWLPACAALILAGAWFIFIPWILVFVSRNFAIPFDRQHSWVYLLISMIPLALAGMLAAGLSWRVGGHRWERLTAAEASLGMFFVSQMYALLRSGGLGTAQLKTAAVGILLFAGYLLAGALPFLLPGDRKVAGGALPVPRSGG